MRNQVKRRLRHLVADRLAEVPDGARLVVRALPPAAGCSSALLGSDLDHALAAALRKARSVRTVRTVTTAPEATR